MPVFGLRRRVPPFVEKYQAKPFAGGGGTRINAKRALELGTSVEVFLAMQEYPAEAPVRLGAVWIEPDGIPECHLRAGVVAPLEERYPVIEPPSRILCRHVVPWPDLRFLAENSPYRPEAYCAGRIAARDLP